ncbi:sugar kinase [Cloacibacillus evryensis]|uniref:sugar kinase n=1 Tax=Cloacibacillus evryensis TaxID=508460 RepID=UPI00210EDD0F|nr:sugar kinase [Cloacibacillus evryensis]MCQ4762610.1 sugar kinase [Cloacibacillus evryensis]
MKRYVTFGELMLRLSPPGRELLFQSPSLTATFGGAEANVAVSLANYGETVSFVTSLPENAVADSALRELRGFGVDTSFIRRGGERVGIYYAEAGSCMRPSKVIYDRAHSSITEVSPADFNWEEIFDGAHWFHTTGITPAISAGTAAAALEAVKAAKKFGLRVSCDLNYRKKLWKWGKSPQEVMTEMAGCVDILIANEEDCQKCLGIELDVDVTAGSLDSSKYKLLAEKIMKRFPNISALAVSLRESVSADWNNWSIVMATKEGFYVSKKYEIRNIVDRIGGGDSFGSGLIWGLNNLEGPQKAIEFAAAASALKHTIYGDYNRVTVEDVMALAGGDASGRVQR